MPTTDELGFEVERRVVLFKSGTVMPDGSLLGYNADPNNATSGATDGQTLIVNSPIGTLYIEDDGTMWRKTTLSTNTWVLMGSGSNSGGGGSGTTEKHVITRGAFEINMQAPSAVFIPMQENNFAACLIEYTPAVGYLIGCTSSNTYVNITILAPAQS